MRLGVALGRKQAELAKAREEAEAEGEEEEDEDDEDEEQQLADDAEGIDDEAKTLIGACLDHGINFFDCAESYSAGDAEVKLGRAFKELGVPREDIVVSTKLWTSGSGPNRTGLSAKRVREGTAACLARLQLEYVDVLLAHRPDDATPMEETVRAFNGCLERGQALWPALATLCSHRNAELSGLADEVCAVP